MNSSLKKLLAGRPKVHQYGRSPDEITIRRQLGGYDDLVASARTLGLGNLTLDINGLGFVDKFIDDEIFGEGSETAIGLFYGAVLLAEIPGAHWRIGAPGEPTVVLSDKFSIAVMSVSRKRVSSRRPTLAENYEVVIAQLSK